jgi:hypothetical protein
MGTGMGGFDRGNSKERGSFDSDVLLKFLKGDLFSTSKSTGE